jgi:2Fe-2S ferredoxin
MPKVTYIQPDGLSRTVDVKEGASLMEGAVTHGVEGIVAICGGACACGTCQVYVEPPWLALTGARTTDEVELLEFAEHPAGNLRLACQIPATAALDGIVVRVAKHQH